MSKQQGIKPVLRYPGSKYKKLPIIFKAITACPDYRKDRIFIDLFGGSGIVGINGLLFFNTVVINDYDAVLYALTKETIYINQRRYDGHGAVTEASKKQLETKIKNGFDERIEVFLGHLKNKEKVRICHYDNKELFQNKGWFITSSVCEFIFLDPPYLNVKGLYHGEMNLKDYKNMRDGMLTMQTYNATNFLLTCSDTPEMREIFKKFVIKEVPFSYTSGRANKRKKVNELFITNYEWEL